MAKERDFLPVKLFCGFVFHQEDQFNKVCKVLIDNFSEPDLETPVLPFNKTTYYNSEMGTPLFRRFIRFSELIDPPDLPDIKIITDKLEEKLSCKEKRIINLDPGILSDANVLIATAKNHYHRVPLDKIYAHLEYMFKKEEVITMEWAYPDFRTSDYMNFFIELKSLYKKQVQKFRGN